MIPAKVVYIDGCRAVDCINYSLVTPVNRQTQSDGYECRLFRFSNELWTFVLF